MVVELQYRPKLSSEESGADNPLQSIYVGWTGMSSQTKPVSSVVKGATRLGSSRDQEIGVVELDATFGRMIGLFPGQKLGILLHLDPPLAHTVHIEPLTPGDWEIIELHATFLELNLLSQIRALPNPTFTGNVSVRARQAHPLTLHLSPTSTANIIVSSLEPLVPSSIPFAKLAPDAEVIVAPKARPRSARSGRTDNHSVASTSQKSIGGRSLGRPRSQRDDTVRRKPVFLRGLSRGVCDEWFADDQAGALDDGLKVWVDQDLLAGKNLRGSQYVSVSIVQPSSLQVPLDPQQQQKTRDQETSEGGKCSSKVVAKIEPLDDVLDDRHAVLSSALCAGLGASGMVGGIVRIEVAPPELPKISVKSLKFSPFATPASRQSTGLKFGGETKSGREAAGLKIRELLGRDGESRDGILNGPLTDGLVLEKSASKSASQYWNGGILQFSPLASPGEIEKSPVRWLIGDEKSFTVEVQSEISSPFELRKTETAGIDGLPEDVPSMVGIDKMISRITSHLIHKCSVLLTGGLGSGKTCLTHLICHSLRRKQLYHSTYFSCRKLVADEPRIGTIREVLNRMFMRAAWGARMGGSALVVLDDLDRLCPAETELQIGGENGRSRHVSELVASLVRQYCGLDSGIVLLATVQNKEALNSIIIGGHVVREIVDLKAPDKGTRRQILASLTKQHGSTEPLTNGANGHSVHSEEEDWMDGTSRPNSSSTNAGFTVNQELDFLDIAGQTDGYMPGDLVLLLARARNEALIRSVRQKLSATSQTTVQLTKTDFEEALRGFTPASLRNVTLQSSTTTFDSIGGLHSTRRILLETLQYPTTYAPIFVQCPLRLRSGLLLYGYPGCGKTLLASAVAGECGLNFISVKGPEILNKYIGASEKSVRDLFERAEAAKPCVLFFDEFDSIAPKRGHDSTGVTDRVVNQLLTQMDGAEGLSGVYVLAATSRPDLIDPALLRPGRLDKSLLCDLPDEEDRVDILRALSKKLHLDPHLTSSAGSGRDLTEIAQRTEGYSGADLQAVMYNAHLEAIHDVLGDGQGTAHTMNGSRYQNRNATTMEARTRELVQFRFGEEEDRAEADGRARSGMGNAKDIVEKAALVAKMEAAKAERRRERAAKRGEGGSWNGVISGEKKSNGEEKVEVVIKWKHIEASMATTRNSIGREERRKLENIYREFIVGRNGEMPSGQGGFEIGGRSSLM